MKLLQDRLLVKPIKKEKTQGGIILPSNTKENQTLGKVVLVSDKCKVVKVGDIIKYHDNNYMQIKYNNEDCLIMNEEHNVIAVL